MKPILLFALLLLAACTPYTPPARVMDDLNREFVGHDSGEFFADFGSAVSSKAARNGGLDYRWVSIEPGAAASHTTLFNRPGGVYGFMDTSPANGDMMAGYCEIRIHTDADLRITQLTLVNDSPGKFSGSRCAEIFGQSPPKQEFTR